VLAIQNVGDGHVHPEQVRPSNPAQQRQSRTRAAGIDDPSKECRGYRAAKQASNSPASWTLRSKAFGTWLKRLRLVSSRTNLANDAR
jgi:hypothetical protein